MDYPFLLPPLCPQPPAWPPPPDWWQLVVVALSNGKDSRVVLHYALARYPRRRILCLYNYLGDEHAGSLAEAKTLCNEVGVPLLYTWKRRSHGKLVSEFGPEVPPDILHADLVLELARQRGQWADRSNPLCTSTGKRDPSDVAMRRSMVVAVDIAGQRGMWPGSHPLAFDPNEAQSTNCMEMPNVLPTGEASRILFLSGERAEESPRRANKSEWDVRAATSPKKGRLVLWHRPIQGWTETQVWQYLDRQQSPAMPACYAEGFTRHSCVHCFHKSFAEQCLAFISDPVSSAMRVVVEEQIGHKVRLDYFLCSCGCTSVRQRQGNRLCADCGRAAGEGYQGYRAVWEYVYGHWRGLPETETWPEARAEAVTAVDRWKNIQSSEALLCTTTVQNTLQL